MLLSSTLTHAQRLAAEDDAAMARRAGRPFSDGTRPVIRWIKGDGQDDDVTRAAIGQATRLFGDRVDYCLCSHGIDAPRARRILEWAEQPVEWWPVSEADNPALAAALEAAGCPPERFGYWWKWFPERVRPNAPEWILDGDMVIVGPPEWWEAWVAGVDPCRVSQDDTWPMDELYGRYRGLIDPALRLYSGLISLPPGLSYMPAVRGVLTRRPLDPEHDGTRDNCEQGVIAAAFQDMGAWPVPLCDFPFARTFEPELDFGRKGDRGTIWGYHFGHAFRRPNHHFARLVGQGIVLNLQVRPPLHDRFRWLGGSGQWGVPGWGSGQGIKALIEHYAKGTTGLRVLEIGTSRGALTALLATLGWRVTTVDRHDRGAQVNLAGLDCTVVQAEAATFLSQVSDPFALIVADLHGNSRAEWSVLWPLLKRSIAPGGMILLSNASLSAMPEWESEDGIPWLLGTLEPNWRHRLHTDPLPGLAVVMAPDSEGRPQRLPNPPILPGSAPTPTAQAETPTMQMRSARAPAAALTPVLPQPYRPIKAGLPARLDWWLRLGAAISRRGLRTARIVATDLVWTALSHDARFLRIERAARAGTGRSLLIYAHYAKFGQISPMVLLQLREYARLGFRIVFVSTSPALAEDQWRVVSDIAEVTALRRNFGRDFGSWADAVRSLLPDDEPWDELLLANDSVVGPLTPLDPVFARFRAAGDGVFGLTEGVQRGAHLQSYFVLGRGASACAAIVAFLRDMRLSDSKTLTIRRGEIGLAQSLRKAAIPMVALHGYSDLERAAATSPVMREALAALMPHVVGEIGASGRQLQLRRALMDLPLNPTHHFAVLLVRTLGFPFLKTEFLLANPIRHPEALDWQDLIPSDAPCDAAMVQEHLTLQALGVAPDLHRGHRAGVGAAQDDRHQA